MTPVAHRSAPHAEAGRLLGLVGSCFVGAVDDAARAVVRRAVDGSGGYVCLCNVHVLTESLHRADVSEALSSAALRLPDGAPVAWLQRRLGQSTARRVGGPDLMPRVVDLGREVSLRHFLLGSTPEVLALVEQALHRDFPGIDIAGVQSPPFSVEVGADPASVRALTAGAPNVVWCALGAPKQELWMRANARLLPRAVFVGVGAAFDFLAATKPRAPRWMRDSGLEWMHRLASEPRRLGARYLRTNSEFALRAGLELGAHKLARRTVG